MSLYLDYNASAPILKNSADAIIDCFKTVGNPSSVHRSGRKVRSIKQSCKSSSKSRSKKARTRKVKVRK